MAHARLGLPRGSTAKPKAESVPRLSDASELEIPHLLIHIFQLPFSIHEDATASSGSEAVVDIVLLLAR